MRSGETVRSLADCPTSVPNISAMLAPTQSSEGSPDALRKGTIARESAGAAGLPEERNSHHATGDSRIATPATLSVIHFHVLDGATIRNRGPFGTRMVWPLTPLCHVSR